MHHKVTIQRRIINILIGIDQLIWVLVTLGAGHPDETISSAMYRYEKQGKLVGIIGRPIIDAIFFWEDQHCRRSYLAEVFRKQIFKVNKNGRQG